MFLIGGHWHGPHAGEYDGAQTIGNRNYEDTPQADLELCVIATERTSDPNFQQKAAEAKAELKRREQAFQIEMFNAQSKERVKAQKFQAAQSERAEEAMASSSDVDPRNVMVVYGRDKDLRTSMFDFLRSLNLNPIEWEQAVKETGSASPHTLEVVTKAFEMAMAVVILMTGDDLARLHPDLISPDDPDYESEFTLQPRANVLLEAGMALALHRNRTVPVTVGNIRRISNIDGINLVRLDGSAETRNALAGRLESTGCLVDRSGSDWLRVGNFVTSRAALVNHKENENQDRARNFSEEEVKILKVLYEHGESTENDIVEITELGSKGQFWIHELLGKDIIWQVAAGMSEGENSFSITHGQADMLRRIGVA